jgi:hypothetical protein
VAPLVRDEEARVVAHIRLGFMAEPTYTVRALDESTWMAFAALVERNNGIVTRVVEPRSQETRVNGPVPAP